MAEGSRYERIIEHVFLAAYREGDAEVVFDRDDIRRAAGELGIELPKNIGDLVYSFRYRGALPQSVTSKAPGGQQWVILPAGPGRYRFAGRAMAEITPSPHLAETKIPDATPGVIEMYALTDEQSLLAKVRYNRLIDIFSGVTCYSLQNHLRTTVPEMGQVETDELYVGIDRKGVHYILPVQAKGGSDKLSIVQIEQDMALCEAKFPALVCRPTAAQFVSGDLIALFEFEKSDGGVSITREKHYRLVPADQVSAEDLKRYRQRLPEE
jgi:hypothetical protein